VIAEKVLNGIKLDDIYIFDIHGHLSGELKFMTPDCNAEGIIETMDSIGVNSICVSSLMALYSKPEIGNNMVIDAAKKYSGRIYGYVSPTPYYSDCDFEAYFKDNPGILGVKIHAAIQQTVIDDPRYFPALEVADKIGLPVLIHTWSSDEVKRIMNLAERYKNIKFIIAHSGMLAFRDSCIEACKKYYNIYVDTAISYTFEGAIEYMVSKLGAEKILYGSDMAFFDCRQTIGRIGLANISESDKLKIFGENAKMIFGIN